MITKKQPIRATILDEAKQIICEDRQDIHGAPEDTFRTISNYWTTYLDHIVTPADVAAMMCLFKIARYSANQNHKDNLVDLIGYAALAAELGDV